MEQLIDYYRQLLESLGIKIEDDFRLVHNHGVISDAPFELKSKQVYLPDRSIISDPEFSKEDNVVFHPLSENVARGGESEVFKGMRLLVEMQVVNYIGTLMVVLADLASDGEQKLTGAQAAKLKHIADADKKFHKFVKDIVAASSLTGRERLFKLFVSRGSKLEGKKYARVCQATFPVYQEAINERNNDIFGVKIPRKKDRALLISLLELIVGEFAGDDTFYSYGSDSPVAPYLDCLLHTYVKLAKRINVIVNVFKTRLPKDAFDPDGKNVLINLGDWADNMTEMFSQRDRLAPMPHNTGVAESSGAELRRDSQVAVEHAPHNSHADRGTVVEANDGGVRAPHLAASSGAAPAPTQQPKPSNSAPPHAAIAAAPPATGYQQPQPATVTAGGNDPYSLDSLMATAHAMKAAAAMPLYQTPGRYGSPGGYPQQGSYGAPAGHAPYGAPPAYGARPQYPAGPGNPATTPAPYNPYGTRY